VRGPFSFLERAGIDCEAQVASWRLSTDAVHRAGGRIVLQLWHGGRACHPLLNGGRQPVAPSAIAITGDTVTTPEGKQPYLLPGALADEELPGMTAEFQRAARNPMAEDFDGVEIHGANGYLLE
jgi:N-ethylmaleimide reductase